MNAKTILRVCCAVFACLLSVNCTKQEEKPLCMVFYPNESSDTRKDTREAFQKLLGEATGRKVEILTTTDYNIALEALVSGKADMAYVGAEGYIQVHNRNADIIPVVTNSGASGTLEDALYHSFIAVLAENAEQYQAEDGSFDLTKLRDKKIAFVSNTSTSGFTIPAKLIGSKFGISSTDDLIVPGNVFSKVLFSGSHPGAQINLYKGDADAAAFAIPLTVGVYTLTSGESFKNGAVYKVNEESPEPFGNFAGTEITVIQSIPVLNAPIVMNSKTISKEDQEKIRQALLSEEAANNPGLFKIEGASLKGMYPKYSEKTKLVSVDDAWYDQIRELTK